MKTYQHQNEAPGSQRANYIQSSYGAPGARLSTFSTAPEPEIADPRLGRCKAKDDTCNGYHTKNSQFCVGHLKQAENEVES